MDLVEKEWKSFMFTDVFDIRKGFYNKHPQFSTEDMVPFIGATDKNNGITGMTTWEKVDASSKTGSEPNEPMSRKRFSGGCICVTNNGSVGYAYYQATDFTCSHDVNPLYLKGRKMTRSLALFIITCIEKQRVCFEYARKWRPKRMVKSRIMLPVDDKGNPDYAYMEIYMKEMEAAMLKSTIQESEYDSSTSKDLPKREWGSFFISQENNGLFKIEATKSGIDRNKLQGDEGIMPYVTRSNENNGWDGFIAEQPGKESNEGNVLSLGLDTQTAFYQPIAFYTGQNIQVLSGPRINKYVALFIIPVIQLQMRSKFNWGGNGATLGRLHKMKIMLPKDESGAPDYDYMEQFMRNAEQQQRAQYLEYKKSLGSDIG